MKNEFENKENIKILNFLTIGFFLKFYILLVKIKKKGKIKYYFL